MEISFPDRVVVVTGAARGQGAVTARLFLEAGAAVTATDVKPPEHWVDQLPADQAERLEFVSHDVAVATQWRDLVDRIGTERGRLDVLVNNAGVFHRQPLVDTEEDAFHRLIATNQVGPLLGMRAAVELLARTRGCVVNVASTAGVRGVANVVAYSSTKWAVRGMTRAAAAEFAPLGVRVNCVIPGLIDTPMAHQNDPGALASFLSAIPLMRMGEPAEVAHASLFLASETASYITGAELVVDGGDTI